MPTALTRTVINGPIETPLGEKPANGRFYLGLRVADREGSTTVAPHVVEIELDADGDFSQAVWATAAGELNLSYAAWVQWWSDRDAKLKSASLGYVAVPSSGPVSLADLWTGETPDFLPADILAACLAAQAGAEANADRAEAAAGMTRAAMVALIAGGFVPVANVAYTLDGFRYLGVTGSTLMSAFGLAGLEPIAPHYLQHWGLTTYGTEGEALAAGAAMTSGQRADQQARLVAAFGAAQGELRVRGWVEFFDRIVINPYRDVHLDRHMDVDGLCASSRFNLSAVDMIAGGLPLVRGCYIASLNVALDQTAAAASGLRADLVAYPPVISAKGSFGKGGHLRVQRAIRAVELVGVDGSNNGGWSIDRLEYSSFTRGLRVNGPLHFVSIGEVDSLVFGLNANLQSIRNDGGHQHALVERADNLHMRRVGVFEGGSVVINASAGLLVQIDALALDGDRATLDLLSGKSIINNVYGTSAATAPNLPWKIRCSGGQHTITNSDLSGDELAQITVTGGDLRIGGRAFNTNLTVGQIATVTGGELTLDGFEFGWPVGARVVPAVEQSSTGALRAVACSVDPAATTAGEVIKWNVANARNEWAGAAFGAGHWISPTGVIRGLEATAEHFGAVGNGTAIDGDAWKRACAHGGRIVANGSYNMTGKTVTDVADGTIITGSGTFIKTAYSIDPDAPLAVGGPDADTFFRLDGVNGFTVEGVKVRCSHPSNRIYFVTSEDCENIFIEDVDADHATYARVFLVFFFNGTTNCAVRRCVARNIGNLVATGGRKADGSSDVGAVARVRIEDNIAENLASEAIDIHWNTSDVRIENNTIRACSTEDATGEPVDIGGGVCSDIHVIGNTIESQGEGRGGIWIKTSGGGSTTSGVRIENNLIDGGHDTTLTDTQILAIRLSNGSSDVLIEGNTVRGFVRFLNDFTGTGVNVIANHVTVHQVGGLNANGTEYVSNTLIQTPSATLGFVSVLGDDVEFVSNTVTNTADVVVVTINSGADRFVAKDNVIIGGTRAFQVGSLGAEIVGNKIVNPTQFGVNIVANIGGARVIGNTFLWDSAVSLAAVNISTGTSNGCIIRSNLAYNTSVAWAGNANLTNSLSEAPLIAG